MDLSVFKEKSLFEASKHFFEELNVPVNEITGEPGKAEDILINNYKDRETFTHIKQVYTVGMIDDAAFQSEESRNPDEITEDYDGILVFAVQLNPRDNNYLPTRSQLSEIARAFNREFKYTPVVVLFQYSDERDTYLAFANTERLKCKKEWLEGEKVGKVSLLRDIDINKTHAGHERILNDLKIQRTGRKAIDSFHALYNYWQEVFSVSVLNKKFYRELQSWYFWAIKEVAFPNAPNPFDFDSDTEFEDALKEHKGKNVIRLLTRLLFIWFIKEKKLIPDEIFEEDYISVNLLKEFTPQKPQGVFATGKQTSMYYRAILQNLFFATLNRETNKREFRKEKAHMNVTTLMRYEDYFKNDGAGKFIELMESTVPFLNGGLFECLDKPHPTKKGKQGGDIIIYEDGFSDRPDNVLQVPDYLFFDVDEEVDISGDIGLNSKAYKNAKTRGLLEILKSYKFTITENTPIEEDVALDPELLGKVFENLLASYNPETKTTARKQTGSFYTPREIVNYMVDESLIAYLTNFIQDWKDRSKEESDDDLHKLLAFDNPENPFSNEPELQFQIIKALDACKILDPACGSGAFPMGILQKMVYILEKVDPKNNEWKQRQIERVDKAIEQLEDIDDVDFREKSIKELQAQKTDIEESFANNELDYGRKLYLIENCIFGVDIQSIAVQISKLRFFISLIVDQKIDRNKTNFGVRPLPNLETKFVAANTLIGIEKPKIGDTVNLFESEEVKKLEDKLKKVRHKLFSSKSPKRKRELRDEDKQLREQIAEVLKTNGWPSDTAEKLATWDPYDQNASSPFFDPEWMFDVSNGFDVVIGNPPYHQLSKDKSAKQNYKRYLKSKYKTSAGRLNLFIFFTHEAISLARSEYGIISYIIPNTILTQEYYSDTRKKILEESCLLKIVDYDKMPFENAVVENITLVLRKNKLDDNYVEILQDNLIERIKLARVNQEKFLKQNNFTLNINTSEIVDKIISDNSHRKLSSLCEVNQGIALKGDKSLSLKEENPNNKYYPLLDGRNINKYRVNWDGVYLDYNLDRIHSCKRKDIFETQEKLFFRRVSKDLIFTYDDNQFFALNTLVVVNKKHDCNLGLKALLAILNSDIINYVYQKHFKSTKKVFSEIQARSVKELPIPDLSVNKENILTLLSEILIYKNGLDDLIQKVSNSLVNEAYLPDHIKVRKIDVLDFVEEDINNVFQGRAFETLSDAEKEKVIAQLHQKWTDLENEVVKRMAQFKEKSPDILKVIMEG